MSGEKVRGRKPAGLGGGGRQETIEAESGRYSRSTRGRIEAEQKARGREQGIANRSAKEQRNRQSRVLNIESGRSSRSQRRKAS